MKKLLLLATLMSGHVMAHSHAPTEFGGNATDDDFINEALTINGIQQVPITITNLNKYPQQYDVVVEKVNIDKNTGEVEVLSTKVAGQTSIVYPNDFRKLPITVQLDQGDWNKPVTYKVCSISVANDGDMFRSKICTLAKLYWKKDTF